MYEIKNIKNLLHLITLISIFNTAQLIHGDELVELNCLNETQCKQFQHFDIKSACIEEQCKCTTSNGDSTECRPLNSKVNNIIGGACPCKQPNAECDMEQNVCYCIRQFMPSSDGRRCIPKKVALGEKCEQSSQCQQVDFNALCDESKKCQCMDQFINDEGKCASILGSKSYSINDTQCVKQYGKYAKYSEKNQHCMCMPGHLASNDNSHCLKISKYNESCTENLQCTGSMGPGGKCMENVCQCAAKYFVEEKKTKEGLISVVCTAIVERGHYCRFDEDCYQRQLNETEQSMDCKYGECNCKNGFYSYNNGECIRGSGAHIKAIIPFKYIIVVLIFAIKYF